MLDAQYVIAPSLEMCFRDKVTGLPLRDGWVYAFKDQERTIPKDFYKLSGTPGNYSYTVLPNPCQLTGIGTFSDGNGNDIIPYWFPYASHEPDAEVELYYIVVTNSDMDPQTPEFVREAWPNFISTGGTEGEIVKNFVANGQFSLHNAIGSTIAPSATNPVGNISLPITQIAPGGWTFERPIGTSSVDNISFPPFGSYVDIPTASPKYACEVVCSTTNPSDNIKDLAVQWPDVNKFSTPVSVGQQYTFAFSAELQTGTSLQVSLHLIKNFGLDGDGPTDRPLTTFTITNQFSVNYFAFSFGNNIGKTIGSKDDYVQLAIRFPSNQTFDCIVTDVMLVENNIVVTQFPETTDAEFNALSLAGYVPPQLNNSTIGLPVIRTLKGLAFDDTQVGNIVCTTRPAPGFGELPTTALSYITSTYSNDGIPYSRLKDVLFDTDYLVPVTGTGAGFITAILTLNQQIILTQNNVGTTAVAVDGIVSTGFAFSRTCSTTYAGAKGGSSTSDSGNNSVTIINDYPGIVNDIATFGGLTADIIDFRIGTGTIPQIANIKLNAIPAGSYFTLDTKSNVGGDIPSFIWYSINGSPATPPTVPGRTAINVDIISGFDTNVNWAQKTANAVSALSTTSIRCIAASAMTPGAFFTIVTAQGFFAFWYEIDGTGTAPILANTTILKITLVGSDTSIIVAQKTIRVINSYQFATPDFRGKVIMAKDGGRGIDAYSIYRYSNVPGYGGDLVATYEWDDFGNHTHPNIIGTKGLTAAGGASAFSATGTGNQVLNAVGYTGGAQTMMKNISMNFYIKY